MRNKMLLLRNQFAAVIVSSSCIGLATDKRFVEEGAYVGALALNELEPGRFA
jgi:hypothetical protein